MNLLNIIFKKGIFQETASFVSENYTIEITSKSNATVLTWGITYIWQGLWLIFNIVLIFKKNDSGYFYREPAIFTSVFHVTMFIVFCLNTIWQFEWCNSKIIVI